MIQAISHQFIPNKVLLVIPEGHEKQITRLAPFTRDYKSIDGKATAFVCSNHQCQVPTTDTKKMLKQLNLN